ncbi:CopD family protein [Sphingomonas naphthae]|uniref:Protoporphyrinogen IX oxidase n=1 Tax=Sphingomonas naphthae TaxID=1813468 RepID=A0ABY7TKH6_9SPHN|nr:CopD family protein [Sphingomonas naphthae]WCT73286.1 CopD family protein [Sphingomonas naphthae]
MEGFLGVTYLWVKAAHITFVIFWMAGLFMLPRFYIYHQPVTPGSAEDRQWIDRERRLRNIILTPSMVLVWVFGLILAANIGLFSGAAGLGWLHAKLLVVFLLSGFHGWAVSYGKKLATGYRPESDRTLRMMNEIPGVAAVIIVILVIVKPF